LLNPVFGLDEDMFAYSKTPVDEVDVIDCASNISVLLNPVFGLDEDMFENFKDPVDDVEERDIAETKSVLASTISPAESK